MTTGAADSGAKIRTGRPRFTGITTYTDPKGRFEFRHPFGWIRDELDELDGVIARPEADDQSTYFAVSVTPLEVEVVADDLPTLRSGFDDGLGQLADAEVLAARDDTYNNIVKVERTFTFTEDGQTRKRRAWAMYAERWQYLVVFQGSTAEEFDYWLPMGNYCFTAFNLPQALWFATDPELRGGPTEED
ncbi:hypothetical protein [Microlunatus speluncae]|uniref:hypothetical protein n=1 Tax=Microlunatus speluncae TaxID=2594267 RepID=UPI0012663E23|nr:hypothetical protein [Microlunatus speluncae]